MRKEKINTIVICYLIIIIVKSAIFPSNCYSQVGEGPNQMEYASFSSGANSQRVDLFTGDLNYSIPVMSIPSPNGSFPINLSYNSGIGLEQRSSWVGLGWSLNPGGAINRTIQSHPDDFKGEYNAETGETWYGSLYHKDKGLESRDWKNVTYTKHLENEPSDIYQSKEDWTRIYEQMRPVHMAYDKYSVVGSITGKISPFRIDNPSVNTRIPMPNLLVKPGEPAFFKSESYKFTPSWLVEPGFRFVGEASNHYDFHLNGGDGRIVPKTTATPYFRTARHKSCFNRNTPFLVYTLKFDDVQPETMSNFESGREGFHGGELGQSRHVKWYSNSKISNGSAKADGFINFTENYYRNSEYPASGIGGFMITDVSGTTYHYSIPVYSHSVTSSFSDETTESNTIGKYAYSWLLTAITGSDFKDTNGNGICDEDDSGYYVKFNYKLYVDFKWRSPYYGTTFSAYKPHIRTSQEGVKEMYYLNSISTKSHTALFIKDLKRDGKSSYGGDQSSITQSLKLNEIILLENDFIDGNSTLKSYLQNNTMLNKSNVIDNTSLYNAIKANQIQKIVFGVDYSLCQNTPNSFDFVGNTITNSYSGKLTLKSIQKLFENDIQYAQPYQFHYYNNPTYGRTKWDGWGAYRNTVNEDAWRPAGVEGVAWNLSEIKTPEGASIQFSYERDSYDNVNGYNINVKKYGGDVRVKEIKTFDFVSGNRFVSKYTYTEDGTSEGATSGVCSWEPEYDRLPDYNQAFYKYYDSPEPMVCYSKVTVTQSSDVTDTDLSKTEYCFTTPNYDMIKVEKIYAQSSPISAEQESNGGCRGYSRYKAKFGENFRATTYRIDNATSMIGTIKSVKEFNQRGHLLRQKDYKYYDKDFHHSEELGVTTQACVLADQTTEWYYLKEWWDREDNTHIDYRTRWRIINTIKRDIPTLLYKVTVKDHTGTSEIVNTEYDFLTGNVLETVVTNSNGTKFRNKKVPAYRNYTSMGPKNTLISNKQMLNPISENYSFFINNAGQESLLSANVTTWDNAWTYREYDEGQSSYDDITLNGGVFRNSANYAWESDVNRQDGTISQFSNFDHNLFGGGDTRWHLEKAITQYDHSSKPTMTMDINSNVTSDKLGGDGRYIIASSGSATYRSFTHCSFEELANDDFFEGEVAKSSNVQLASGPSIKAHTGAYYLKVSDPTFFQPLFKYKPDEDIQKGRKYRTSVWVHESSPSTTTLLLLLDGTIDGNNDITYGVMELSSSTIKVGKWNLLTAELEVPENYDASGGDFGFDDLRVLVYDYVSGSSSIFIDDLRFQPVDSPTEGYVYNKRTGTLKAVLSNENFATFYSYDAAGRKIKTDKETLKGIKKVSEVEYHHQ